MPDRAMPGRTNIQFVVDDALCTGCATCAAVCDRDAISMMIDDSMGIYVPVISTDKCVECARCVDACPGHSFDMQRFNEMTYGRLPDNRLIGNYEGCYLGHATDKEVRANASSGGLVTALLIHALDQGLIDGAIVTKMSHESPMEPEIFVARTREDIISASRSKYCPTPLNTILRWVIENDGRYAIVGLPCHIQGLEKAGELFPELNERIALKFALVCNHTPTFVGIQYLLSRKGVTPEDVSELKFRGNGWPGAMQIRMKSGDVRTIPFDSGSYWGFVFQRYFFPPRCSTCIDKTCEESDISFMDAWIPSLRGENEGHSLMISRTARAEKLVNSASEERVIELDRAAETDVEISQSLRATLKARAAMIAFLARRGRPVPSNNRVLPDIARIDLFKARLFHIRISMSASRRMWFIIRIHERARIIGRTLKHKLKG